MFFFQCVILNVYWINIGYLKEMELKLIEIFIFFITLITTFYCYWTKKISKIAEKGLKFKYPTPYFGNNFEISFKSKHISLVVDEIYQNFPLEK